MSLQGKRVLLVVSGSVAAYKALELARLLGKAGATVTGLLTAGGARFVTPHALQAITGRSLAEDLWSLRQEAERGHIRLARETDLVVVAPASADRLARMAAGMADDLAGAVLLAWDGPVLVAPAMNPTMWAHPATGANVATLMARGVHFIGPEDGPMAEAESGTGRLSEPPAILAAIEAVLSDPDHGAPDSALEDALDAAIAAQAEEGEGRPFAAHRAPRRAEGGSSFTDGVPHAADHRADPVETTPSTFSASQAIGAEVAPHSVHGTAPGALPLNGRHVLVTSGPTHEPLDPVRYIANRSSGKQGHAIAAALAALGARVTLVSGPVTIADPVGVTVKHVETAREMLAACEAALPADAAVFAAAVADWRPAEVAGQKMKKPADDAAPPLALVPNPDILATLSRHPRRPGLVVGFAAETERVVEHARAKLARKGCDWIVANDVSGDVMGGAENLVHLVTASAVEDWPRLPKAEVAARLADRIAETLRA
ncbi:bifunctional phosphopantothenoylcysteine decarboxylase/phosphopantothenate synthase [Roseomonas pecuniae]|uniref:Coenzyme A biosynthesis bifunctional protein CoaBC n=1 Tax=Roseomonas populi TaxID=3121582 RepID=A0ABT1XCC0_9PROT|nr:bifunctional phosphopantothenoylcysteine decarboxylase/phosphopantothenate synthase [Roseomonas pecuniae]MCR0984634.1 bifunctional phosphopantothenoylcysteine decarboxylase/phosphopantothenate synthase [Roseomonas pecuniae]